MCHVPYRQKPGKCFHCPWFFGWIPPTAGVNISVPGFASYSLSPSHCWAVPVSRTDFGKQRPRGRVEATDDGRSGIFTNGSFAPGRLNDRELVAAIGIKD